MCCGAAYTPAIGVLAPVEFIGPTETTYVQYEVVRSGHSSVNKSLHDATRRKSHQVGIFAVFSEFLK